MLSFLLILSCGFFLPEVSPLPPPFILSVFYIFCSFWRGSLTKQMFWRMQVPAACLLIISFLVILNTGFDSVLLFRSLSPVIYVYAFMLVARRYRDSTSAPNLSLSRSLSFLSFAAALLTFAALIFGPAFIQAINSLYAPESSLANVESSVRLASLANGRLLTTFKQPLEAGTFSLLLFTSILVVRKDECNKKLKNSLLYAAFASLIPGIAALSKVAIIGPILYFILDLFLSLINSGRLLKSRLRVLFFGVICLTVLILISVSVVSPSILEFFQSVFSLLVQNPFAGRYYETGGIITASAYLKVDSLYSLFFGRSLQVISSALDSELVFVFVASGLVGLASYLGFLVFSIRLLILSASRGFIACRKSMLVVGLLTIIMVGTGSFLFYNPRTCPISCLYVAILGSSLNSACRNSTNNFLSFQD